MVLSSEENQLAKVSDIIRQGGDPLPVVEDIIRSSGIARNVLVKRLRDFAPTFKRFREPDGVEYLLKSIIIDGRESLVVERLLDYLIWYGEE